MPALTSPYSAILFDADRTLWDTMTSEAETIRQLARGFAIRLAAAHEQVVIGDFVQIRHDYLHVSIFNHYTTVSRRFYRIIVNSAC